MKIIWHQNPLRSSIQVDVRSKKILKDRIKLHSLTNFLHSARLDATSNEVSFKNKAIDKILKFDMATIDAEVEDRMVDFLEALESWHAGDCTQIPCSCMKCWAESMLDIDTLEGLYSPAEASYIAEAFGGYDGEKSIDEALDYLKNYKVEPLEENEAWKDADERTRAMYEDLKPEWEQQARRAYVWLEMYKTAHFGEF